MSSCLVAIRDRLAELIHAHEPDCCALESVIYVQSHKTAITLGAARGSAILAAAERGLPVFEYAPKRIKQATVGNGSADKAQVAFMVRALLGLTETPGPDAADALAIGLTHLRAQEARGSGCRAAAGYERRLRSRRAGWAESVSPRRWRSRRNSLAQKHAAAGDAG